VQRVFFDKGETANSPKKLFLASESFLPKGSKGTILTRYGS